MPISLMVSGLLVGDWLEMGFHIQPIKLSHEIEQISIEHEMIEPALLELSSIKMFAIDSGIF